MIKPIDISPINTTKKVYFECGNCGKKNTIFFTNRVINVDKEEDIKNLDEEPCPNCG